MLARHAVTVGCLLSALSLLELCIIMDVRWNLQRLGDVWPAGEGFLGRRQQERAPPPAASQDASLDITDVDGLRSGLEATVGSQETRRQAAVVHDGRPPSEATSPVAAVEAAAAAAAAPPEGPAAPVAVADAEPAPDAYSPVAAPAEATSSSASAVEAAPPLESPAAAVASVDAGAPAVDTSPVAAPAEETFPASPVEEPAVAVAPPESPAAASPLAEAASLESSVGAAAPESPAAAAASVDAGAPADVTSPLAEATSSESSVAAAPPESPAASAASADAGAPADVASPVAAPAEETIPASPVEEPAVAVAPPESPAAASPVAAVEAAPAVAVAPPESPAAANSIADAGPAADADSPAAPAANADAGLAADAASPVAAPAEAAFPASLVEEASSAAVAPFESPEVAGAGVDAGTPADAASPVTAAEETLPASPAEEPAVAPPESPAAARPEEATPLASQADVAPEAAAAAPAETPAAEPSTAAAAAESEPLQAPKQFVLLSSQRSGSTWLCNLMNHMKGVQCGWREGESGTSRTAGIVSEMMMTYSFLQRRGWMSIGETYPDLRGYSNKTKVPWRKWVADYDRAMKMIADQAKSQRVRAIGFKLMYDQLPSYHLRQFLNHLRERGIIVIHLVREAQLQRFASLAQANPEFMHTTNETAAHYVQEHTPKLKVALQRIKDFVFRNEFKDTIWKRSLVFDKDITYFYVAYEHLLMHNKRLPALLLIPVLLTGEVMDLGQLVADQYKLHSSKCSKRFDNYEKIMQSIRNTTTHHACRMLDRLEGEGDPVSSS